MNRRHLVWLLLLASGLAYWWSGRPASDVSEEAIDWHGEPIQGTTSRSPFVLETTHGSLTLTPRASYDVAAVVASTERYRFDTMAFLSPLDLALLWGELPEAAWRERIDYSQGFRAFTWRTEERDVDAGYVIAHAANTHIIPANRNLERALLAVDAGDAVRLQGLLVDVSGNGLAWRTSLVRTDHGDHGCEVLWVESLEVDGRRYR